MSGEDSTILCTLEEDKKLGGEFSCGYKMTALSSLCRYYGSPFGSLDVEIFMDLPACYVCDNMVNVLS